MTWHGDFVNYVPWNLYFIVVHQPQLSCNSTLLSRMVTQSPAIIFQVTRKEERHEECAMAAPFRRRLHTSFTSQYLSAVTNAEHWGLKTHFTG